MVPKTSPNTSFCGSDFHCADRCKQMKWDFVALVSHDVGSSATVGEVGVVCVDERSRHP